jgi:putative Holliday junction resolvase
MTRLIALDVGEVRIGVAVSDSTGFLASPYTTLHVSRDEDQTWAAIAQLIDETGAEGLVIGLPISLDGQIHAQGQRVLAFTERLKEHIHVPVTFWDERLSTVEAQRLLAERDQYAQGKGNRRGRQGSQGKQGRTRPYQFQRSKRRQKGHEIDALAAAVILQEYLDSQGSNLGGR